MPRKCGTGIGVSPKIPTADERTEFLEMIQKHAEQKVEQLIGKGIHHHTHHMNGRGGCESNQVSPAPRRPIRIDYVTNDRKRTLVNHIVPLLRDNNIRIPAEAYLGTSDVPRHLVITNPEKAYIINRVLSEPNDDRDLSWYNSMIYSLTEHGTTLPPYSRLSGLLSNHSWFALVKRFGMYKKDYAKKKRDEKTAATLALRHTETRLPEAVNNDVKTSGVVGNIVSYL